MNWDLADFSVATVPIAWIFIARFANPALLEWNLSAHLLPVYTFFALASHVSRKGMKE